MEINKVNSGNLYFLRGGGEMGSLIRQTDWKRTPLGDPIHWPDSLRTAVAIMMENPFGMYIAWGTEYTQLYNDGYRPILGATKHPKALGISTKETFEEIWHIVKPMFDGVMKGTAVWAPDFMYLLNRNGFTEECYFDFAYSPIRKEDGEVGGVLVTVIETTNRKKAELALKESEERFRNMADNIPNLAWMAEADGSIFWYNKKWYEYTGTTPDQMKGWGWQSVHDPEMLPEVLLKWRVSIASGKPFDMVFPLRGADGRYRQFLTRILPVYDSDGKIYQWFGTNTDITDRINAEQDLKESEDRFRTMAESTDILIATSDDTGNATYFNKAWTKLTGRSMEHLVNFGWVDLIHDEDRQGFLDNYLNAFKNRDPWFGEFRMENKKDEYRWLLSKGAPRFRPEGSFAGYISSSVDITERINAEEIIKENEKRFRFLIEEATIPTFLLVGPDMIFELANPAMLEVLGKGDSVIGKRYLEALPEFIDQPFPKQLSEVYTSGHTLVAKEARADIVVNGKMGTYYFDYTFKPLRNVTNKVYAIMCTAINVTDKVIARKALENTEQNLRNTIIQAPVAMCILKGPNHRVELANDRMFELWGKTAEDAMNKPIFEGLPEAKNQGFEKLLDGVYNTGVTFAAQDVPINLPRKGHMQTVYVNFVYEAFRESTGTITGVLVVAVDVTSQVIARQKIEEVVAERTKELAEVNKNLQKSNDELAQFAYIASHDLQEPLRKISTFSQMLESRINKIIDDQSINYLNKIRSSASRMNTLIKDVLTYSELVKENEIFKEVDLNQVTANIVSDYELLIEQKAAKIQCANLPIIEAIPLQMSQLFSNIIGNSLKFSRNNISPVILISANELTSSEKQKLYLDESIKYYKIQFKDNGIGFKEEYAQKIFNIFQRLHRKSEYEGNGIGLAMCKKIALNHHGDLNAFGSSEDGAIFNVILPFRQTINMERERRKEFYG